MTLPPEDPHKLILDELLGERSTAGFDPTQTDDVRETPGIHTGWYSYASGGLQISISNFESSTVGGGETGITASTGTGVMSQIKAGTALMNVWATREDVIGIGEGGANVPVKEAGYQIAKHAADVVNAIDVEGTTDFGTIAADDVSFGVDTESYDETVYRWEITIRFTWSSRSVA